MNCINQFSPSLFLLFLTALANSTAIFSARALKVLSIEGDYTGVMCEDKLGCTVRGSSSTDCGERIFVASLKLWNAIVLVGQTTERRHCRVTIEWLHRCLQGTKQSAFHARLCHNALVTAVNSFAQKISKLFLPWPRYCEWPRGLIRRSVVTRLLRLWVRIPLGAWMCNALNRRGLGFTRDTL